MDNGLGEKVVVKEKHYLGNQDLPTPDSEYQFTPEMVKAMMKCKGDIIYFAESFFTIIADGVKQHIPLRAYQKEFLSCMSENKRLIINASRQVGKTTLMTIYALWLANFYDDQRVIICGNKIATAMEIFDRIRSAYQDMPNWLKCPIVDFSKKTMTLANGSKIETGATTETAVRGKTVSCLILDEFAFVEPTIAKAFWSAVIPTMVTNKNAKLFVSSTPNGIGNMFYDLWQRASSNESDFKQLTVKWDAVPGRDSKWKEDYIKNELGNDRDLFEQEFECRFIGASNSPFPPKAFEFIESTCTEPLMVLHNGNLHVWKYPENNRVYAMGVDIGEGLGKDASVATVFDMTDLSKIEQVACYYTKDINTTDFTERVYDLADMYGQPCMAVERNGIGSEVCTRLFYDKNYPRFITYGASAAAKTFRPGITSQQNTKSPAVLNMKYWLIDNPNVYIRDIRFLRELRDFERKPNGGWGAKNGPNYHDDYVMSVVWCLYMLHRDIINQCFIVKGEDNKGKPLAVENKFSYHLTDGKEMMYNKYSEYRGVPVIAFTTGRPINPEHEGIASLEAQGWQRVDSFMETYGGFQRE